MEKGLKPSVPRPPAKKSNYFFAKINDLNVSTKFLGTIFIILMVLTSIDIWYNAKKELEISHQTIKTWSTLFAENVRVSLNTLMRDDRMDLRFEMFENMAKELRGLKHVHVFRGERTNEIFREINEKDIIPQLKKRIASDKEEMLRLQALLKGTTDRDERDDLEDEISIIKENMEKAGGKIISLMEPVKIDERERAENTLEKEVLRKGESIYKFDKESARVLIPYKAKKGCMDTTSCHKYAHPGDVLGGIELEFSMKEVNRQIEVNNLKMAAFWALRFVIFLAIIAILLTFIVTKDLKNMTAVFKKVAEGDLSVRAPEKKDDEVGRIAKGFNMMADSLEKTRTELDRKLLEVFALYNIGKVMNTSFEIEHMLANLVEDISRSTKIDKIIIMLRDESKRELYVASSAGFDGNKVDGIRRGIGEGFFGNVASMGKGRLVREVDVEESFPSEDKLSPDINSVISVPFFAGGEVLGLICVFKESPSIFEPSDMNPFIAMADHLTVAMENSRSFEETREKSIRDGLTGLYNRGFFEETLESELAKAVRYNRDLSIFMLDVDDFKHYNDTHGHPEGDVLLKTLTSLVQDNMRSIDYACRFGGEEFVVIMPETSKQGGSIIAERLVNIINKHSFPFRESQPLGFVSVSVGLASYPDDGKNKETIIKKMDEALYRAKREGKNRLVVA